MRTCTLGLALLSCLLGAPGCASVPAVLATPLAAPAPIARTPDGRLVADTRQGGALAATITLPRAARALLDAPHRWLAEDVLEYRLALSSSADGSQFAPFSPPVSLSLATKGADAATGARLTGLQAGLVYRVALEAYGNAGGVEGDATTLMNGQTPCTADFDFRPDPDDNVPTDASATMTVIFDPLVIDAMILLTLGTPQPARIICGPNASAACVPSP